jgi:uncharacterized RDD family membrane protein YckC
MEQVKLHKSELPAAGLLRRLAACVYDWMLVLAIMMVASVPVVASLDDAIGPGNPYYQISLLGIAVVFFAGFWSYNGQTPGMRAWRLRVVHKDGRSPPHLGQCLMRFLYAGISVLGAGCGFWWMLFDAHHLTWHDRWSGTRIQRLPKRSRGK